MPMNPRVKKKWLKALRSGCYKQGQTQLLQTDDKGNDLFCCLGVLCNIHAEETKSYWDGDCYLEDADLTLPSIVQKWAGLDHDSPEVVTDGSEPWRLTSLADLNDSDFSFKSIAKFIEEQL